MKQKILIAFILFSIIVQAQSYVGSHYSTKDAILSTGINPAMGSVVDVKWQVNLFGMNANFSNNYFALKELKGIAKNFDKETSLVELLDGEQKNVHVNLQFNGPAVYFKIKNNALSIGTKARAIITVNDMNEDLIYSMYHDFQDILNWIPNFKDDRVSGGVNAYHEIYAGYARKIEFGNSSAFHLGVNVKLLTNLFNAQFTANDIDFNKVVTSATDSFINVGNTKFDFLVSDHIQDDKYNYKFGINGFGIDVGAIYELRKSGTREHFLLLGFSVNDIGSNSYNLGSNSRTFVGNNTNVNTNELVNSDGSTINIDEVLDKLGTKTIPTGKQKMKLPMVLNTFADIRIVKMLYANANFQFNPYNFKKGDGVANMPTNITITPRFETRIFSAYLPVNWNKYSNFNVGAGFRIGQVTIGSSNIITAFTKKNVTGLDLYMNIGFGKIQKNKTKENDSEAVEEN